MTSEEIINIYILYLLSIIWTLKFCLTRTRGGNHGKLLQLDSNTGLEQIETQPRSFNCDVVNTTEGGEFF